MSTFFTPNIRSDSTNIRSDAIIGPKNSVDAELRVEDDLPLMPLPRNHNSNIDDLEINLDTITFHGSFYQLDLGNSTKQIGVETSVDMCSYRDTIFEIRQIGMSMVYSIFASEFCNTNVS